MFEEKAQSYRVKDKEIYRVKLACQNTKVYRVNTHLTKGTSTLLDFFCFFFAYAHAKRVRQVSCERVRTVPCACNHLIHCFPVEGHNWTAWSPIIYILIVYMSITILLFITL